MTPRMPKSSTWTVTLLTLTTSLLLFGQCKPDKGSPAADAPGEMSDLPPKNCQRCGKPMTASTMSMFNTQWICMECQDEETKHPDYEKAREAEFQAVKAGNRNFPGIGWPR